MFWANVACSFLTFTFFPVKLKALVLVSVAYCTWSDQSGLNGKTVLHLVADLGTFPFLFLATVCTTSSVWIFSQVLGLLDLGRAE